MDVRILVALNPDSDNGKRKAMISIGAPSSGEERQKLEFQEPSAIRLAPR